MIVLSLMILSTASFVTTTIAISKVVPIYSDYWCIVVEHISRTCPSFLRLTSALFAIVIAYIARVQANGFLAIMTALAFRHSAI